MRAAPRARAVATAKAVAHAAKAEARPAPMDAVKDAAKDVEKDAIAVADAAHVVANAAVSAAANASVLMPKENRWPLATTPRAWPWMPTAPRARARHADAADAIAIVANAVSAQRTANARRIALATRLHKRTPMATTTHRERHAKAVKADAAVVVVAGAMTVARVWMKPVTRFLQHQAKTKPMDKPLRKAQTTKAATAAAHATVMAASVAHVAAAMSMRRARNSNPRATSRCASPSAPVRTAMYQCARTSHKQLPRR